jgi:GT2 family glycosyltransferase|tara:strand:+ start:1150 stop:2001 length:852 start_codon:yes stop_codon:yes gene_type:complete
MVDNNITIVINTFRSEDKIFNCLNSIDSFCKVIIIENSDNKDFKKKLENKYSFVECFLTGENLGYANGNNLGLSKVKSEYALILNPDTTLEKETLYNFLNTAKKFNDFAIIGPARQDEYSNIDLYSDKADVFEVDALKGFAMLLNLKQFNEIGFFDSNFFIYLEEIDLCRRLKEKGKKIYLDKNIKINHVGGSSHNESINFEMELSRNWHWMWSLFYFNRKHFGYLNSLIKVSKKFISSFIKMIFFAIIFRRKQRKIYFQRFSGLFNSIIGKKSWYRPKILIN